MNNIMAIYAALAGLVLLNIFQALMGWFSRKNYLKKTIRERSVETNVLIRDLKMDKKGNISLLIGTPEGFFRLPDVEESITMFKKADGGRVKITYDDIPSSTLKIQQLKGFELVL